MNNDLFADTTLTLREHVAELFARLLAALTLAALAALPGALVAYLLLYMFDGLTTLNANRPGPAHNLFLWAILFSLSVLHYLLPYQLYIFFGAGLYPHERRLLFLPLLCLSLVPLLAVSSLAAFLSIQRSIINTTILSFEDARPWLLRLYLIFMCIPLLLFFPKRILAAYSKMNPLLTSRTYFAAAFVICILPNHACDSILVSLYYTSLCAIIILFTLFARFRPRSSHKTR